MDSIITNILYNY